MDSIVYFLMFLSLLVQIIFAEKINGCNNSNLESQEGQNFQLGCWRSNWFGSCILTHKTKTNTNEVCTYTAYSGHERYETREEPNCKFRGKIEFVGNVEKFYCAFKLKRLTIADSGFWTITMISWYGQSTQESSPFVLKVMPIEGDQSHKEDNNFDYQSNDLKYVLVSSAKNCQFECLNHEKCQLWSFGKNSSQSNICYLKELSAINSRTHNVNITSGQKIYPGCFLFGIDLNSDTNNLQRGEEDAISCQKSCYTTPTCVLFQWMQSRKKCTRISYSYKGSNQTMKNPESILGLPNCFDGSTLLLANDKIHVSTSTGSIELPISFLRQNETSNISKLFDESNSYIGAIIGFVIFIVISILIGLCVAGFVIMKRKTGSAATEPDIPMEKNVAGSDQNYIYQECTPNNRAENEYASEYYNPDVAETEACVINKDSSRPTNDKTSTKPRNGRNGQVPISFYENT